MAKNVEEIKTMEFMDVEDLSAEDQQMVVEVKKQNKLVAAFKGLKTWQKVLIGVATVAGAGFGGKYLLDVIKTKPEVVTEMIETADGVIEKTEF